MKWFSLLFVVALFHGGLGRNFAGLRRQTSSSGATSGFSPFSPVKMGSVSGAGAMNPFAAQSQMNHAGFQSSSSSISSISLSSGKNTNFNPLSGPSGALNPFNTQASSGQQSTSGKNTNFNPLSGPSGALNPFNTQASPGQQSTTGYSGPAGNPMQSGNPMDMNPFGGSTNATSNSSSQSTAKFPSNMNPFGSNQMSSTGFSSTFDPNKINGMAFSSLIGRGTLVKRQASGGSSTIPKYDPNAVNQLTSSFLDPSKSMLGAGGATGGMYNPDQWNTISFNMFNPQSQLGKRYIKRQTAQAPSTGGSMSPSAGSTSGGSSPSGSSLTSGASQTGGASQSGGASQAGSASQTGGVSQTGGSSQTSGASQLTQPSMFTNPGAFTMGGGSPSSSSSSSGSSGGSSSSSSSSGSGSGSGGSGSSSSSSIPSFDPNKLNQIMFSFLDPSKAQLGQGGGGGSGFNPDQINSQVFNFFNPNLMMGGGRR